MDGTDQKDTVAPQPGGPDTRPRTGPPADAEDVPGRPAGGGSGFDPTVVAQLAVQMLPPIALPPGWETIPIAELAVELNKGFKPPGGMVPVTAPCDLPEGGPGMSPFDVVAEAAVERAKRLLRAATGEPQKARLADAERRRSQGRDRLRSMTDNKWTALFDQRWEACGQLFDRSTREKVILLEHALRLVVSPTMKLPLLEALWEEFKGTPGCPLRETGSLSEVLVERHVMGQLGEPFRAYRDENQERLRQRIKVGRKAEGKAGGSAKRNAGGKAGGKAKLTAGCSESPSTEPPPAPGEGAEAPTATPEN